MKQSQQLCLKCQKVSGYSALGIVYCLTAMKHRRIRGVTKPVLTGSSAVQLTNDTIESAYSSVALHPDGQILGTGTEQGIVHVWETKSQNVGCLLPLSPAALAALLMTVFPAETHIVYLHCLGRLLSSLLCLLPCSSSP